MVATGYYNVIFQCFKIIHCSKTVLGESIMQYVCSCSIYDGHMGYNLDENTQAGLRKKAKL